MEEESGVIYRQRGKIEFLTFGALAQQVFKVLLFVPNARNWENGKTCCVADGKGAAAGDVSPPSMLLPHGLGRRGLGYLIRVVGNER